MTNVKKIKVAIEEFQARQMLRALEKLLELYKEKEEHSIDCPLCSCCVSCDTCPWFLFTGKGCGDYRDKHFPKYLFIYHNIKYYYPAIDNLIIKAWRKRRLHQLPRWIKYYEQALVSWEEK